MLVNWIKVEVSYKSFFYKNKRKEEDSLWGKFTYGNMIVLLLWKDPTELILTAMVGLIFMVDMEKEKE